MHVSAHRHIDMATGCKWDIRRPSTLNTSLSTPAIVTAADRIPNWSYAYTPSTSSPPRNTHTWGSSEFTSVSSSVSPFPCALNTTYIHTSHSRITHDPGPSDNSLDSSTPILYFYTSLLRNVYLHLHLHLVVE